MGQPNEHLGPPVTLPNAREELRRVDSLGNFVDVLLVGEEVDRQTVLARLQDHAWVHFACHGHQADEPFLSYFQLYDNERLTLIMKARLPSAELAFLSACHSAATDTDTRGTPDESIHLAAALQFCGFQSVVGTLWAMADVDGPNVAEDFYKYMYRESAKIEMALSQATRAMRKREGITLDRWIAFVHIDA